MIAIDSKFRSRKIIFHENYALTNNFELMANVHHFTCTSMSIIFLGPVTLQATVVAQLRASTAASLN
jgi:hypothetical protein